MVRMDSLCRGLPDQTWRHRWPSKPFVVWKVHYIGLVVLKLTCNKASREEYSFYKCFYEYYCQLGMHLSRSFRCSNSASKKHVALLRCAMTNRLRWSRGMCSLSQSPTISTNSSSEEGRSSLAESSRDLAGDGGGIWAFISVSMRTSASRLSTCSHWKSLKISNRYSILDFLNLVFT